MEIREKEILKRSESLFKARGFKGVTMDDIARDMGMSKKTVYKYFDNKKDLIQHIIKYQVRNEKDQLCSLEEHSKDAIEEMMKLIRHVVNMFDKTNAILFEDLEKYYPESWKMMNAFMSGHIYNRIVNNIKRGIEERLYRENLDPDILAKMYVAKVRAIMEESVFPKRKYNYKQLLRMLIEYHIRGIASAKGISLFEQYKTAF